MQPGRALERRLAVECGIDPARPARARSGTGAPRARRCGTSAAARPPPPRRRRQPARRRAAAAGARRRRRLVVEHPVGAGRVDGRHHAARVAGQVVEVAQRDLDARRRGRPTGEAERPADRAGAAGDHDREREVRPSTSGSLTSVTTKEPTRSTYHSSPRRDRTPPRASGSGASPGGKIAASSTRPRKGSGKDFLGTAFDTSQTRRPAPLGELVGDDQPLDLAGALPDPLDPQLAEEPLGDVLAHVAAAAEDLERPVRDPVGHLGGVQLDHRAAGVQHLACRRPRRSSARSRTSWTRAANSSVRLSASIACTSCRSMSGWPPTIRSLREGGRLVDQPLGGAEAPGGDHQPLEAEPLVDEGHAVLLAPDQVAGRHADALEGDDRVLVPERVRVRRRAHDAHAGGVLVDARTAPGRRRAAPSVSTAWKNT